MPCFLRVINLPVSSFSSAGFHFCARLCDPSGSGLRLDLNPVGSGSALGNSVALGGSRGVGLLVSAFTGFWWNFAVHTVCDTMLSNLGISGAIQRTVQTSGISVSG